MKRRKNERERRGRGRENAEILIQLTKQIKENLEILLPQQSLIAN